MPSGRTHDSITLWSLPLIAGLTFARTQSSSLTLCIAGGYLFSGLMFGPDLDIYSYHYKRWGWLRWIWLPYRRSMRHRSFWSHAPIAGTVVRIAYLLIWVGIFGIGGGLASAIACQLIGITNDWSLLAQQWFSSSRLFFEQSSQQYSTEAIAIAIGLELGALSHTCSDWMTSTYRRAFNQRSKKAAKSAQQPSLPPDLLPSSSNNDPMKPSFLEPPPQTRREPQLPPFRRRRDDGIGR
ncbi:metal-binding protein [Stenomitos frigidus]|uniref:Metal-binding protein n=1 Tax=Stenomitos frigidus ULC18 TaxID=2107698 RepID=A0A2T1E2A0_9CYAN|nr:metal-binding protein [Stenomitos frigidus]PSB26876.1 metal-binding protein [Stenomitos frigidus ULC18]